MWPADHFGPRRGQQTVYSLYGWGWSGVNKKRREGTHITHHKAHTAHGTCVRALACWGGVWWPGSRAQCVERKAT
eukprot:scaffold259_cov118-Isochrysis_galbana.AAC.2